MLKSNRPGLKDGHQYAFLVALRVRTRETPFAVVERRSVLPGELGLASLERVVVLWIDDETVGFVVLDPLAAQPNLRMELELKIWNLHLDSRRDVGRPYPVNARCGRIASGDVLDEEQLLSGVHRGQGGIVVATQLDAVLEVHLRLNVLEAFAFVLLPALVAAIGFCRRRTGQVIERTLSRNSFKSAISRISIAFESKALGSNSFEFTTYRAERSR